MRYIDLDGVILNTEGLLFNEILNTDNKNTLSEEFIMQLVININWAYILKNAKVINDSIDILRKLDKDDSTILTRVHSNQEAETKINYFKSINIDQKVITVPYPLKKNDVVSAKGNILIDDCLKNLRYWSNDGGYAMFFDKNENNIDSWDEYNINGYQRVLRIDESIKRK